MALLPLPSREQEGILHQRLLDGDPTATYDVFRAYLKYLTQVLRARRPAHIPEHFIDDAVQSAFTAYFKAPSSYRPERGKSLKNYLYMSARGDLLNIWECEAKHHEKRVYVESVEHLSSLGNEESEEDAPNEHTNEARSVLDVAKRKLSEGERAALELFLQGERKTTRFAAALGIQHLTADEQRKQVKRVKDKLKKRIQRARGEHDESA